MVELESPLGETFRTGSFGNFGAGTGVTLSENQPGSIIQVHAWPDRRSAVVAALATATGLSLDETPGAGAFDAQHACFGIAPGRFMILAKAENLIRRFEGAVGENGTVTDLTHGRTVFRIEGPKAEWVLSKLFAIDFREAAFPVSMGRATVHHDINAQIQRVAPDAFDLVVFRSFARSFWIVLGHASEEVGYSVL